MTQFKQWRCYKMPWCKNLLMCFIEQKNGMRYNLNRIWQYERYRVGMDCRKESLALVNWYLQRFNLCFLVTSSSKYYEWTCYGLPKHNEVYAQWSTSESDCGLVLLYKDQSPSHCVCVCMKIRQHLCVSMEKYLICIASAWQILLGTDCDHGGEEESGLAQT